MKPRYVVLLALLIVAGLVMWGFSRKEAPPPVPFAKVTRERVISTLNTNGKVEPIEWASARAERSGVVERVYVERGQQVRQNAPLVSLNTGTADADLESARARISEAQAQREVVQGGGRPAELTDIEASISRARFDLQQAQKEYDSTRRLLARQAATQHEVDQARQRIDTAQLQIRSLEQRRAALIGPSDKTIAEAKVAEAHSQETVARRNLSLSLIRAPIDGTVYQFDLRKGAFVNPGDLVANVGKLDRVRVTVYVDEPDLGRVEKGMPVTITWDAMPGRQWKGSVERVPTQVVPLGTRQVGEVSCVIDNPDRDLLPGTNINAEIQSRVVENALTIPKEALRREANATGVMVLQGEKVYWRRVSLGVSSLTRAQVLDGLKLDDSVALPTERQLKNGMRVEPMYP